MLFCIFVCLLVGWLGGIYINPGTLQTWGSAAQSVDDTLWDYAGYSRKITASEAVSPSPCRLQKQGECGPNFGIDLFGVWVLGFGRWVLGVGFWVLGFRFEVFGFGYSLDHPKVAKITSKSI